MYVIDMGAFPMRFMLKVIILIAICFALYHFFGPQIDSMFHKAKNEMHGFVQPHHSNLPQVTKQERQYYPIEKRTQ
jgi:hypothetical protein